MTTTTDEQVHGTVAAAAGGVDIALGVTRTIDDGNDYFVTPEGVPTGSRHRSPRTSH